MREKSTVDRHWNERALQEKDDAKTNIGDTVQRDFELQFIRKNIKPGSRILEVGCGNGYVTNILRRDAAFVDGFDFSENMIERARRVFGETNNRFFHDDVLGPKNVKPPYDAIVCVRVLINLRDVEQQQRAVRNLAGLLSSGGRLILIEGYRDGFESLNALRSKIGMETFKPAPINFYSSLSELMPTLLTHFIVEETWHSGVFDFLTRIVYPAIVGADKVNEAGGFHEKIEPILHAYEGSEFAKLARLHGFVMVKR